MAGNIKILFVNDDDTIAKYFIEKLIVEGGYTVVSKQVFSEAIEIFKKNTFDVVIAKFNTVEPMIDNAGLVREFKNIDPDCVVIGIIDEANAHLESMLKEGLYGFMMKPFNSEKLMFLITKGTALHSLAIIHRKLTSSLQEQNGALQKQNVFLAKRIEESTLTLTRLYEDLRSTYMRTIKALAETIDARDHYTHSHSENVAKYAVAIAEEMHLPLKQIQHIREACELHDLGKIGIEDSILSKPSSLSPEEWEKIKRHPATGAQILEPLTFLKEVVDLVRQHHEHYDGSGYPEGRKREEILLGARIIHLADAYEAMTSPRSYRKIPFTKEQAIEEIKKNSGTQFDPLVIEAFLRIVDRL